MLANKRDQGMRFTVSQPHSATPVNFRLLPRLLRSLGVLAVIASFFVFLLQGWKSGNDGDRYLLLLAHTVGLAAMGFGVGHWLRENKGARLLLLLALVSVPVNFAILGAFIYSASHLSEVTYPVFATWQAEGLMATPLFMGGAILVLAPVIWLAFRVLASYSAWSLTGLFFATNGLLLIPLREESWVAWVLLGASILVFWQIARIGHRDSTVKTMEGVLARGLQFLPLAILFGRTVWFYTAGVFYLPPCRQRYFSCYARLPWS